MAKKAAKKTFGQTLREKRIAKGYSLRKFAEKVKVSPTYLWSSRTRSLHRPPGATVEVFLACVPLALPVRWAERLSIVHRLNQAFRPHAQGCEPANDCRGEPGGSGWPTTIAAAVEAASNMTKPTPDSHWQSQWHRFQVRLRLWHLACHAIDWQSQWHPIRATGTVRVESACSSGDGPRGAMSLFGRSWHGCRREEGLVFVPPKRVHTTELPWSSA
jgi:hypothetical protein